jgi:hypothetical protein
MSIEPFPHRIRSACCSIRGHLRRPLLWHHRDLTFCPSSRTLLLKYTMLTHKILPSLAILVAPALPLSCIIFQIKALQFHSKTLSQTPNLSSSSSRHPPQPTQLTACILPVAFSWTGPYLHHHEQSPSSKPRAFPKSSLFLSSPLLFSSQSWLFVLDAMPNSWLDSEARPLRASDALHPSFRSNATSIPNHAHQIELPRFNPPGPGVTSHFTWHCAHNNPSFRYYY